MKQSQRTRRIADLVVKEIGSILLVSPLESSAGFVTITGCEVSTDLRVAKVYFSAFGGDEAWEKAAVGLDRAKVRLRREIASRLKLRHTPELAFFPDHSIEEGAKIEALLRKSGPSALPDDEEPE